MDASWLYVIFAMIYCSLWFFNRIYSAKAGLSPIIHPINAVYFTLVAAVSTGLDSNYLFALGVSAAIGFYLSITRGTMASAQVQTEVDKSQFTIADNE